MQDIEYIMCIMMLHMRPKGVVIFYHEGATLF